MKNVEKGEKNMFDAQFWAENWVKLLFGLLSAGIIAYLSFLLRKYKTFKKLEDDETKEKLNEFVESKLVPLQEELEKTQEKFEVIKESYRYRLLALCELYLKRDYITYSEYHQLSEMWKVYHGLGGNSQAEDLYYKVEKLPVKEDVKG